MRGSVDLARDRRGFSKGKRWALVFGFYALSLLLVLTCNSLPFLIGNRQDVALAGIACIGFVLIFALWSRAFVPRRFLQWWIIWTAMLLAIYGLIGFTGGAFGGKRMLLVFLLMALFPLLMELLCLTGNKDSFLRSYVNVAAFFAALSLVLWLLGPVLGIISTNCYIENSWTGTDYSVMTPGYFGLHYLTQTLQIPGGAVVVRNTSLFAEAPMYSLVLTSAFVAEAFFIERKVRLPILLLLAVTVSTTFSTAGIVAILVASACLFLLSTENKSKHFRVFITLVSALLLIVVVLISQQLVETKLNSGSGGIRADDIQAGLKAWANNYVFGNGFGGQETVRGYMSAFRAGNIGFSNTLLDILAKGGIVYLIVYLIPAFGFLRADWRMRIGFLVFLFVWIVTISTNLPLTFVFFSLGFMLLVCGSSVGDAEGDSLVQRS